MNSDTGVMKMLFGPLSHDFCNWFLFLSIMGLISILLFIIAILQQAISKKHDVYFFASAIAIGVYTFFFGYVQNRLLYNMCKQSK